MRGVRLALEEFNYTAGGKKIELITGSSDASPDSAVRATRKLVEQDGVQVLIGPLSGSEGLAVKDYAKTQPDVTFLNGSSRSEEHTSELQSLMRTSYAVFCWKNKIKHPITNSHLESRLWLYKQQ